MFDDVKKLYTKFEMPILPTTGLLPRELMAFRFKFMQEELDEMHEAYFNKDLAKTADAIGDLVYAALGTAVMMNLPMDAIWDEIQRANMDKERGATQRSPFDLIKPKGWREPDIEGILTNFKDRKPCSTCKNATDIYGMFYDVFICNTYNITCDEESVAMHKDCWKEKV